MLGERPLGMTLLAAGGLLASTIGSGAAVGTAGAAAAPVQESTDSYIVVLEPSGDGGEGISTASEVREHADTFDVTPTHVYTHALEGYAAELTPDQVAQLEADENVAYVEEDGALHTQQQADQAEQSVPTGVERIFGPDNPNLGIGVPRIAGWTSTWR